MEPGLIIIGGVVSCILAIFFGVRESDHKHKIDVLECKLCRDFDAEIRADNARCREVHRQQARLINSQYEVAMLKKENKQNQVDITCFRAELGLGPRLYPDSANHTGMAAATKDIGFRDAS